MKLSVIIVNYNVKHFLEQCLLSVVKASESTETEIIVVDNASVDGSCQMVRGRFPGVRLIENETNLGFSVANNQAIRESKGEFILLLNPDTVVGEDAFTRTLCFMEEHLEAGGLGVKMINGKGKFLPESKRGLPTPWVAFYKISGISRLFPKSKKFGKYHLSWLDENEIHPVDVLCGAFMLLRRSTLDKTGFLDESYFMYGEDIDLSYRIMQSGYTNYYYPEVTIIHYKGESTRKGSINYVILFYKAMDIFARKHFSQYNAKVFSLVIQLAIYFRALIAIIQRVFRLIYLPLLDALIIYTGFALLVPIWEQIMFDPGYYPVIYMRWVVPAYILLWLTCISLSGGYRSQVNIFRLSRGIFWGSAVILIAYSLTDEALRFSRAMIIIGALWALIIIPFIRVIFSKLKIKGFELDIERHKRIAIAGHPAEAKKVSEILGQSSVHPVITGYISLSSGDAGDEYLGTISQLKEIIKINHIDEIIFCAEGLSSAEIIRAMLDLTDTDVDFKIAPPESLSIIGSNSIHTAGDLYLLNINAITRRKNKRNKRICDIAIALVILCFFWLLIWFIKNKKQLLINAIHVLTGKLSWVGYISDEPHKTDLPIIKNGILNPGMFFSPDTLSGDRIRQLNILYAKDYRLWNDLELVFIKWKKLDASSNV